jgi:hypothetical protein
MNFDEFKKVSAELSSERQGIGRFQWYSQGLARSTGKINQSIDELFLPRP